MRFETPEDKKAAFCAAFDLGMKEAEVHGDRYGAPARSGQGVARVLCLLPCEKRYLSVLRAMYRAGSMQQEYIIRERAHNDSAQ